MKKDLIPLLICPSCLPGEIPLRGRAVREEGGDILEGELLCRRCERVYPIEDGIAFLDPSWPLPRGSRDPDPLSAARPTSKYETAPVVSSYLWSHYGDLLGDPEATSAYREWAQLMTPSAGMAIDLGCAVGRFTLEMTATSDLVIGVDNSVSFIRCARQLMTDGRIQWELKEEGFITREETLRLPDRWDRRRVEFMVADAQALPFPSGAFHSLASLNLIDKVPFPASHLREVYRLAPRRGAQFFLSDPFSWSEEVADPKDWLGGTREGPFAGRGLDNIAGLLSRETEEWSPPWRVERRGAVWWKIRTHANHFELIRSRYVKAVRDA